MTEQQYQSKIIKSIEDIGGIVVNGSYTKAGIADLICGYPIENRLIHLHIEVKTEAAYKTLFDKNIIELEGFYVCNKKFTGREVLQAYKLNEVRRRGGLALFAYSFEQVKAYCSKF